MYKLTIVAKTKSKAKLHGIPVRQYVFGQNFEVYYIIKNISQDQNAPEGIIKVQIKWQNTDLIEEQDYDIPELKPGQEYFTGTRSWGVLSHIGSFHIASASSKKHPRYFLYTVNENEISSNMVFHAVFGMPPEGVYELWALLISAFGLLISAISLLKIVFLLTRTFHAFQMNYYLIVADKIEYIRLFL